MATYNGDLTATDCSDTTVSSIGWFCGNESLTTHPVGQKTPNAFGLYDMSGNVSEWVWDWWNSYPSSAQTDPDGPNSGTYRILRGGAGSSTFNQMMSSRRDSDLPGYLRHNIGFRLARTAP